MFLLSLWMKDSKIATIYAIFGFLATYISGKGKISCYFFGIIALLLYSYLAWKNSLYGSLILYIGYYLPMEFIGLFLWKNHLKKDTQEIEKTFLSDRERIIYGILTVIINIKALNYYIGLRMNTLEDIYNAIPNPKLVVAAGACACMGGVYKNCYGDIQSEEIEGPVENIIPVDAKVPGCAVRPQDVLSGVVASLPKLLGAD